jgi:CRP-like cAMP-binding protein
MRRTESNAQGQIAALDLFAECSRRERELIARLATITDVKRGAVLCRQGEVGQSFFIILAGSASVTLGGDELARLGRGSGFGEVALLRQGGRRVATVSAATPMKLVVFSRPEFATLIAEVPRVARDVLRESERRLSETKTRGLTATS